MNSIIHTIFLSLFCAFGVFGYNSDIAHSAVWLSGAAYCGKENYNTMKLAGPATDFIVGDVLYDPKTDLQGYTGVLKSDTSIYVVFRGSSSKLNWMADFEVIKDEYLTFPECGCKVHHGFYKATKNLKDDAIKSVKALKQKYGYSNVIVTGHSLAAAVGQMIGMELAAVNIKHKVYNFGQPRVGDKNYAHFVNLISEELYRFTHDKDMVPHVPPQEIGYLHSCREIFEDKSGKLKECSADNGEDPTCADQYSIVKTNTDDHIIYLWHYLNCGNSTTNIN